MNVLMGSTTLPEGNADDEAGITCNNNLYILKFLL